MYAMTQQKTFCSGALIIKDRRFLFGKRVAGEAAYAGLWDVAGGHNEGDETPEETLKRELVEELGIRPTEYKLFYEVTVDDERGQEPYQFYIFLVTEWEGELSNCCNEHSELRWFTTEELKNVTLSSSNYWLLIDKWQSEALK